MKLIDKENGRSLVEVKEGNDYDEGCRRREYATKGLAGTALGFGIAGTALALFNGTRLFGGGGLFGGNNNGGNNGCSMPYGMGIPGVALGGSPNIAIASANAYDENGVSSPANVRYLERKECSDVLNLTNALWQQAYNAQTARGEDRAKLNEELFGVYAGMRNGFDALSAKHNKDAFDLYKYSRDSKDDLQKEIGDIKYQLGMLVATRPYQDALIQCDIQRVAEHANFDLWKRTCRMIQGEVVLPNTPVVTGYASQRCCCNAAPAAETPAA